MGYPGPTSGTIEHFDRCAFHSLRSLPNTDTQPTMRGVVMTFLPGPLSSQPAWCLGPQTPRRLHLLFWGPWGHPAQPAVATRQELPPRRANPQVRAGQPAYSTRSPWMSLTPCLGRGLWGDLPSSPVLAAVLEAPGWSARSTSDVCYRKLVGRRAMASHLQSPHGWQGGPNSEY